MLDIFPNEHVFRMKISYLNFNIPHIKNLQNEVLVEINQSGINAKILDNYPNTLSYQLQLLKKYENSKIGFFFEFASTGSRIDYRDYSGKYSFDQILNRYALGFHGEQIPLPNITDNLVQYIQFSYLFTTFDLQEKVEIFGETLVDSSTLFFSNGGGLELGISYIFLEKPLLVMFDVSGSITYSQTFFLHDNYDAKLSSEEGLVRPTWSGIKFGIVIGYNKYLKK